MVNPTLTPPPIPLGFKFRLQSWKGGFLIYGARTCIRDRTVHRGRQQVKHCRSAQSTDASISIKNSCFKRAVLTFIIFLPSLYRTKCIFVQFVANRRFSSVIWLLFLDTNTSLEQFFTDINIPFDCQFLVAQPQSDHVVLLTEVYRVSPTLPLQTYRFGNWTAGGSLTWPSQCFYMRRKNLKGLTIQATRLGVRRNCTACEMSNSSLGNRAI